MIDARQELLRRRLRSSSAPGSRAGIDRGRPAAIPGRREGDAAPLSAAQLHSWHYAQANPGSLSDTLGLMFTFDGEVEETALIDAFAALVARHEILRSTYVADAAAGGPRQVIHRHLPFPCESVLATQEAAWDRAQALLRRPFDLTRDAPLRLLLCRTGPSRVILTLVVHHILWDGATFDLLCRELEQLYAGASLPALQYQYGDLAEWEALPRDWTRQERFWRNLFGSHLPKLSLVACTGDVTAPAEAAGRLDAMLASGPALRELARAHRVTPFKAFMACWARVLWAQSPQEEILLGTTVLNREMPESRFLIGNFANHVPLRLPMGMAPRSDRVLPAVAEAIDCAFACADLPYRRICALSDRDDPTDAPRLFDSLVVFIPNGTQAPRLPHMRCCWERLHTGATQFPRVPLGLEVFVHGHGAETRFAIEATYARRRFDHATVRRLIQQLEATISDAAQQVW